MPKFFPRFARRADPVAALPRWRRFLGQINAPVERLAARCSRPYFLRIDARALWFYAACLAAFAILSVLGFHGSSIEIFGPGFRYSDASDPAVLGHFRATRVDEWNFHTPAILNQLFRVHPLALDGAADGPGKAALMTNVPCRHFTQLFRPQFWGFHLLPAEMAFAVYWQAKALLLLTGVFTLLLLLTRRRERPVRLRLAVVLLLGVHAVGLLVALATAGDDRPFRLGHVPGLLPARGPDPLAAGPGGAGVRGGHDQLRAVRLPAAADPARHASASS